MWNIENSHRNSAIAFTLMSVLEILMSNRRANRRQSLYSYVYYECNKTMYIQCQSTVYVQLISRCNVIDSYQYWINCLTFYTFIVFYCSAHRPVDRLCADDLIVKTNQLLCSIYSSLGIISRHFISKTYRKVLTI